jgi:hypothetical protein
LVIRAIRPINDDATAVDAVVVDDDDDGITNKDANAAVGIDSVVAIQITISSTSRRFVAATTTSKIIVGRVIAFVLLPQDEGGRSRRIQIRLTVH